MRNPTFITLPARFRRMAMQGPFRGSGLLSTPAQLRGTGSFTRTNSVPSSFTARRRIQIPMPPPDIISSTGTQTTDHSSSSQNCSSDSHDEADNLSSPHRTTTSSSSSASTSRSSSAVRHLHNSSPPHSVSSSEKSSSSSSPASALSESGHSASKGSRHDSDTDKVYSGHLWVKSEEDGDTDSSQEAANTSLPYSLPSSSSPSPSTQSIKSRGRHPTSSVSLSLGKHSTHETITDGDVLTSRDGSLGISQTSKAGERHGEDNVQQRRISGSSHQKRHVPWKQIASLETVSSLGVRTQQPLSSFRVTEERKRLGLSKVIGNSLKNRNEWWTEQIERLKHNRHQLRLSLETVLQASPPVNSEDPGLAAEKLVSDILTQLEKVEGELLRKMVVGTDAPNVENGCDQSTT